MFTFSRKKVALHSLTKTITKILNPLQPEFENIEDSHEEEISDNDLEGRGFEKNYHTI